MFAQGNTERERKRERRRRSKMKEEREKHQTDGEKIETDKQFEWVWRLAVTLR